MLSAGERKHHAVSRRADPRLHLVVGPADLVEPEDIAQARVDLPLDDQLVVGSRFGIVGPMRALEPLLADPVVAEIDRGAVPAGAGADHHHAPRLAYEDRRRDGRLTRVLEHERGIAALPKRLPERATAPRPVPLGFRVLPVWGDSPVIEATAVDVARRAEAFAIAPAFVARYHRDRPCAHCRGELDRLRTQAARAAPHQNDIIGAEGVSLPSE